MYTSCTPIRPSLLSFQTLVHALQLFSNVEMSSPPKHHAVTCQLSNPAIFFAPRRLHFIQHSPVMFSFTNWMSTTKMEKSQAEDYLTSLLGKTLRVTTNDTRMFLGQFKCTDSVRLPSSLPPIPFHILYPPPKPKSNS
jgi:hypothetical protein